jgi:hypothetical protein
MTRALESLLDSAYLCSFYLGWKIVACGAEINTGCEEINIFEDINAHEGATS